MKKKNIIFFLIIFLLIFSLILYLDYSKEESVSSIKEEVLTEPYKSNKRKIVYFTRLD